jgi:hypothetical protein
VFGFTINAKTPNEQNPLELKDIKFNDAKRGGLAYFRTPFFSLVP